MIWFGGQQLRDGIGPTFFLPLYHRSFRGVASSLQWLGATFWKRDLGLRKKVLFVQWTVNLFVSGGGG